MKRCMGFRDETGDIYVEIHADAVADRVEKLEDRISFPISIGHGKSYHEVKLGDPPAPILRLLKQLDGPLQRNKLIQPPLPLLQRSFHGEGQPAFSNLRELTHQIEGQTVDSQRREREGNFIRFEAGG